MAIIIITTLTVTVHNFFIRIYFIRITSFFECQSNLLLKSDYQFVKNHLRLNHMVLLINHESKTKFIDDKKKSVYASISKSTPFTSEIKFC